MSSENDSADSRPLNSFFWEDPPSASDAALDSLSEQSADLHWKIRAERFCWIAVTIVLVDLDVFTHMTTWAGPVVIGGLELVILIVLARHFGIRDIVLLLNRLIDSWGGKRKDDQSASSK